ncbi:MAG: DNA-processing protein DprA [Aggregatilineales bacterium]
MGFDLPEPPPAPAPPDVAWLALSLIKQIGGKTFRALLAEFDNDPYAVISASTKDLRKVPRIGEKIAAAIHGIDLDATQNAMTRWLDAGVQIMTFDDPRYPQRFKTVPDAPPILFMLGGEKALNPARTAAIIGTREPSPQAKAIIPMLVEALVQQDVTVMSGLAFGVDYEAHFHTLSHGQRGCSVAVLGSGILNIYPREHTQLAQALTKHQQGAILCEVAPSATVSTPGLVARNRLISGLSDIVIIVESSVTGGAMHARRFATTQGRRIATFDLPQSGNQQLLKDGALKLPMDDTLINVITTLYR